VLRLIRRLLEEEKTKRIVQYCPETAYPNMPELMPLWAIGQLRTMIGIKYRSLVLGCVLCPSNEYIYGKSSRKTKMV